MKIGILTMFNGLNQIYCLVNVVAEHLQMLLNANIPPKILVTEHCSDEDRFGVYLDKRIEWAKVVNKLDDEIIKWHNYSCTTGQVHKSFLKKQNSLQKI